MMFILQCNLLAISSPWEHFVPKLHFVAQSTDNVTDPFTSGSSVITVITQTRSSYAGGDGSDLAIVLTGATFSDEDSPAHVRWMNRRLKNGA